MANGASPIWDTAAADVLPAAWLAVGCKITVPCMTDAASKTSNLVPHRVSATMGGTIFNQVLDQVLAAVSAPVVRGVLLQAAGCTTVRVVTHPLRCAIVPAVPFLNLGPSFSIEFWIMLDRDGTHTLAISVGGIWTQGYVTVSIR